MVLDDDKEIARNVVGWWDFQDETDLLCVRTRLYLMRCKG